MTLGVAGGSLLNQRQPYRRQAAGRPGGSRLKAGDHVTRLWGGSCRALAVRDNPGGRCPRLPEVRPGRREYRPRARRSRLLALSRGEEEVIRLDPARQHVGGTPASPWRRAGALARGSPCSPRPLPWRRSWGRTCPRPRQQPHGTGLAVQVRFVLPIVPPRLGPRPPPPWHDVAGDVSPETMRYVGERYLAYTCM